MAVVSETNRAQPPPVNDLDDDIPF